MRLIDADALYEAVSEHVTTVSVCPTVDWARGKSQMKVICLEEIANAPTVDASPVVHGRWIYHKHGWAECSECHHDFHGVYDLDNADYYCRHCGAKMDAEVTA